MSSFHIFPFSKVHINTSQLFISLWGRNFVSSPLVGYEAMEFINTYNHASTVKMSMVDKGHKSLTV